MTPDVLLAGGETLEARRHRFEVLAVPGHSPAHLAYYADGASSPATSSSPARSAAPTCRGADWESCSRRSGCCSTRFPPETVVYPGHGPTTTLGAELARNPFLAELRAERR